MWFLKATVKFILSACSSYCTTKHSEACKCIIFTLVKMSLADHLKWTSVFNWTDGVGQYWYCQWQWHFDMSQKHTVCVNDKANGGWIPFSYVKFRVLILRMLVSTDRFTICKQLRVCLQYRGYKTHHPGLSEKMWLYFHILVRNNSQ